MGRGPVWLKGVHCSPGREQTCQVLQRREWQDGRMRVRGQQRARVSGIVCLGKRERVSGREYLEECLEESVWERVSGSECLEEWSG